MSANISNTSSQTSKPLRRRASFTGLPIRGKPVIVTKTASTPLKPTRLSSSSSDGRSNSKSKDSVVDMFKSPRNFSDFILVVEGTDLHVHRSHLACCSPVFRRMLMDDHSEKVLNTGKVRLPGKLQDMAELLALIYDPAREVTEQSVPAVLPLAHEYQVAWLMQRCETWLMENRRGVRGLVMAQKYGLTALEAACLSNLKARPLQQVEADMQFVNLDYTHLSSLYGARAIHLETKVNDLVHSHEFRPIACGRTHGHDDCPCQENFNKLSKLREQLMTLGK